MRLLLKITIIFLLQALAVFLVGSVITYQVFKNEVIMEEQRFLMERLQQTERMIKRMNISKEFKREKLIIQPLGTSGTETEPMFSDTLVMHSTLDRIEPHTKLNVTRKIGEQLYKITLYDIIIEQDDIVDGVKESMIKIYFLLILVFLLGTILLSTWIFRPFNLTLQRIKQFSIKGNDALEWSKSGTTEFNQLNRFLDEMTSKIRRDYKSLKEFTENASHEMQTPLAIIKGKMELLMNDDNLTEDQRTIVSETILSIEKQSKMVQSLALLTKIENKEFSDDEIVDLSKQLKEMLDQFSEMISLHNLNLKSQIDDQVTVKIDPHLLRVLFQNLIGNAIKHNIENGDIEVVLKVTELTIKNTGQPIDSDPSQLFQRFRKIDQTSESLGLGLSIVKQICDTYGIPIEYTVSNRSHILKLDFRTV